MSEAGKDHVSGDDYALTAAALRRVAAPELPYGPRDPVRWRPKIGLIGAGGITRSHLDAYRRAGYEVAAICDRTLSKAQARAAEFYPDATCTTEAETLLGDDRIEVLDIATHPRARVGLIERAIAAGRHVLSQKPFVLDLDTGRRLVALAEARGVQLAVNQNGRWAPHLAWMREAVRAGHVGEVAAVHTAIHWDHSWIAGTPFEEIDHLILSDFGIHWFDFLASLVPGRARRVRATSVRGAGQKVKPPLFAQAMVELEDGQASLVFDGGTRFGALDTTHIVGGRGSLASTGPDLGRQQVRLMTDAGEAVPALEGSWFNDGFHGAMAELLSAVEAGRAPLNNARDNLESLAICFAAVAAARSGDAVEIGSVARL